MKGKQLERGLYVVETCNCRWQGPVFVIINRNCDINKAQHGSKFARMSLTMALQWPGLQNCIWITSSKRKESVFGKASPNLNKNDRSWVSKQLRMADFSKLSGKFYLVMYFRLPPQGKLLCILSRPCTHPARKCDTQCGSQAALRSYFTSFWMCRTYTH